MSWLPNWLQETSALAAEARVNPPDVWVARLCLAVKRGHELAKDGLDEPEASTCAERFGELGALLLRAGQADDSGGAWVAQALFRPDDDGVRLRLALACAAADKWNESLALLEQVRSSAWRGRADLLAGHVMRRQGNYAGAADAFVRARKAGVPMQETDSLALAEVLANAGQWSELRRVLLSQKGGRREEWRWLDCIALAGQGRHGPALEQASKLPKTALSAHPALRTTLLNSIRQQPEFPGCLALLDSFATQHRSRSWHDARAAVVAPTRAAQAERLLAFALPHRPDVAVRVLMPLGERTPADPDRCRELAICWMGVAAREVEAGAWPQASESLEKALAHWPVALASEAWLTTWLRRREQVWSTEAGSSGGVERLRRAFLNWLRQLSRSWAELAQASGMLPAAERLRLAPAFYDAELTAASALAAQGGMSIGTRKSGVVAGPAYLRLNGLQEHFRCFVLTVRRVRFDERFGWVPAFVRDAGIDGAKAVIPAQRVIHLLFSAGRVAFALARGGEMERAITQLRSLMVTSQSSVSPTAPEDLREADHTMRELLLEGLLEKARNAVAAVPCRLAEAVQAWKEAQKSAQTAGENAVAQVRDCILRDIAGRVRFFTDHDNTASAISLLEEGVRLFPNEPTLRAALSDVYVNAYMDTSNRLEELAWLRKATKLAPESTRALRNLCLCLFSEGLRLLDVDDARGALLRFREAAEVALRCLRFDPRDDDMRRAFLQASRQCALAGIQGGLTNDDPAVQAMLRRADDDGLRTLADHFGKEGLAHASAERWRNAETHLETSLALVPDQPDISACLVHCLRARMHALLNHAATVPADLLRLRERLITLDPSGPEARDAAEEI